MVAGSILPVAFHDNQLYFLFGKECSMENSAKGWSDFGGGCEDCAESDSDRTRAKKVLQTAVREGAEESTGFLGSPAQILEALRHANDASAPARTPLRQNRTRKQGQVIRSRMGYGVDQTFRSVTNGTYTVFFMPVRHDAQLPLYFNRFHQFVWKNMDRRYLNRTKLFEKSEMEWFTVPQMRSKRRLFRGFYRTIVDDIIVQSEQADFVEFVTKATR